MANKFNFLGIPVFDWDGWEDNGEDIMTFYDVIFEMPSMKQYDGNTVDVDISGKLVIFNEDGDELWENYFTAIPEFMAVLRMRHPSI